VRVGKLLCFGVYTYFCVAPFSIHTDFGLDADYYGFADVLILVMADITAYSLQSTVYSLQSTVYSLQSTVYSLQSTVYSLQLMAYTRISMSCGVFLWLLTYYTDV
jgi:hypothetical protein